MQIHTEEFYVYELSDSRGVFYIGSGTHGRMYQHVAETKRKLVFNATHRNKRKLSSKEQRIASALSRGEDIRYEKVYTTSDRQAAYQEEKRRIAAAPYLTNIAGRLKPHEVVIKPRYRWDKGYKRAI